MRLFTHPVFVISALVFVLHQITQKILGISIPVADAHLDNVLCLPILLSMLLAERRWWWRRADYVIPASEVAIITIFLTLLFELAFPYWSAAFTADYWDAAAYAVGAGVFYFTINNQPDSNRLA
ncbi:MAG: hypothetical protein HUU34_19580 [Saprospiraceae bacterium]|jgi:hypothetical protein|nr:hypothetical protein [Saprospiraceae bacterium]